jgi:Domain of unknown function (DUF5666)
MSTVLLARWKSWAALSAVVLATALGCSMGGDSGGVGVGGTGNQQPAPGQTTPITVNGPITGFGSVIVRGTTFDDRTAAVLNEAGVVANGQLRLGMTVEIEGDLAADGLSATATKIRIFSELKGPAGQLNVGANSFEVLGSVVKVDASTVFDGATNLAALQAGNTVVVYGYRNLSTGEIFATRVEVKVPSNPAAPVWVNLRGSVQSLDTIARTFSLGAQAVNYPPELAISGLINGANVQVGGSVPAGGGLLTASAISIVSTSTLVEGRVMEFEGYVTEYVDRSNLKIAGYPSNAASTSLSATAVARLANGTKCEVHGKVQNGVVQVTSLECDAPAATSTARDYEVSGTISSFTSIASFVARGQTINASTATFSDSRASDLALGKKVAVKGPVVDGVLMARSIKVE